MIKKEKGQAMVEFALVLPILLTLVFGIIDFGWLFGNQIIANNACREAARYTAIHYNDSSEDNDKQIAYNIITDRAPTLSIDEDSGVTLDKSEETVSGETIDTITIYIDCYVPVLTPFLSSILGDQYNVKAETMMRLE